MKTIKIWDSTHTKLALIKAVNKHKTFDETIEYLIEKTKEAGDLNGRI